MHTTKRTQAEIGVKADETYTRLIKRHVEPVHQGKFITLDIDSGDYELSKDSNGFEALARLKQRNPNGQFYLRRVGEPSWVDRLRTPRFRDL